MTQDRVPRWMYLAAIFGVAGFWITVFALGFAIPEYDQLQHQISLLTTSGAPLSGVGRAAFVILGLGVLCFASGLRRVENTRQQPFSLAVGLFVLHGIGRIGEGLFPVGGSPVTDRLHTLFGMPGVLAMVVLPFVVYRAGKAGVSEPWGRDGRIFGLIFAGIFLLGAVIVPSLGIGIPVGLTQRIGFLVWYLWLIRLTLALLRRDRMRVVS